MTFWESSLALYRRPGVPEACLRLQDRDGLDVNLVLWCLWLGATGRRLDAALLGRAMAAVAPWRARAVLPLRDIRRDLKPGVPGAPFAETNALRESIKKLELETERIQHLILEALAPAPDGTADAVAHALLYAAAAGASAHDALRDDVGLLAAAHKGTEK